MTHNNNQLPEEGKDPQQNNSFAQTNEIETVYRNTVRMCAQNSLNLPLANGHEDHAAVIFEAFFDFAQKEVSIFTGELYGGIFNRPEIITKALEFIRKVGNTLSIVFQNEILEKDFLQKPFIQKMIEGDTQNNIKIFNGSNSQRVYHYAVMDKTAYRREISHSDRSAIANFGTPSMAEDLYQDFKKIVKESSQIYPPKQSALK